MITARTSPSITPSLEDYLEAILEAGSPARVTTVARRLGVSKASVSRAARKLTAGAFVEYPRYGRIALTARGARAAAKVVSRHRALATWLETVLRVPAPVAARDACVLEHGLSPETAARLLSYVAALSAKPPARRRQG